MDLTQLYHWTYLNLIENGELIKICLILFMFFFSALLCLPRGLWKLKRWREKKFLFSAVTDIIGGMFLFILALVLSILKWGGLSG